MKLLCSLASGVFLAACFLDSSQASSQDPDEEKKYKPVTEESWIITGTTPIKNQIPKEEETPVDVYTQGPYVHWTCFRQKPAAKSDVVHCCQDFYAAMQNDPERLCFVRGGCTMGSKDRSEFLRYCTQEAVYLGGSAVAPGPLKPQFSLLEEPRLTHSEWTNKWIQYITNDPKDINAGQWLNQVVSPIALARETSPDVAVFTAQLNSSMVVKDDAEDERFLHQKIQILEDFLKPGEAEKEPLVLENTSLDLAIFLPQGVHISRSKGLSSCLPTKDSCPACTVALTNTWDAAGKTSKFVEGQRVQHLSLNIAGPLAVSDECKYGWTIRLILDEDDTLLFPAPALMDGTAKATNADETLLFKHTRKYDMPLITSDAEGKPWTPDEL